MPEPKKEAGRVAVVGSKAKRIAPRRGRTNGSGGERKRRRGAGARRGTHAHRILASWQCSQNITPGLDFECPGPTLGHFVLVLLPEHCSWASLRVRILAHWQASKSPNGPRRSHMSHRPYRSHGPTGPTDPRRLGSRVLMEMVAAHVAIGVLCAKWAAAHKAIGPAHFGREVLPFETSPQFCHKRQAPCKILLAAHGVIGPLQQMGHSAHGDRSGLPLELSSQFTHKRLAPLQIMGRGAHGHADGAPA